MSQRQQSAAYGPDHSRLGLVGFCDSCGRVLEPMDYLECAACYLENKHTKRRYSRASAQRQLDRALERIGHLAKNPMLCHWVPHAAILFGSMLDPKKTKVGDVDLCVIGRDTAREKLETSAQMISWTSTEAPTSTPRERLYSYPRQAAQKFIKKQNTLLSLVLREDFASVGGGRPFPYEIVWLRVGGDAEALRATIDAARLAAFSDSIEERRDNVRRILGETVTRQHSERDSEQRDECRKQ